MPEESKTEETAMAANLKTPIHIAGFLERFRAEIGWNNEIEFDEKENRHLLFSQLEINRQTCRIYIEGHVTRKLLSISLFPSFNVMEGKYVDACMLFNFLNDDYQYHGRISVDDNGKILYKQFINLENLEPATAMILNMFDGAVDFFSDNGEGIAAVALTPKTYESIRKDYESKDAES